MGTSRWNELYSRVPPELGAFQAATNVYLSELRNIVPVLEQWADVHCFTEPLYGQLLDEVRTALRRSEMGTPAALARVTAQINDVLGG